MDMTGPEPTYIPLDEFLTAQILNTEGDFDQSELVLEDEFSS